MLRTEVIVVCLASASDGNPFSHLAALVVTARNKQLTHTSVWVNMIGQNGHKSDKHDLCDIYNTNHYHFSTGHKSIREKMVINKS